MRWRKWGKVAGCAVLALGLFTGVGCRSARPSRGVAPATQPVATAQPNSQVKPAAAISTPMPDSNVVPASFASQGNNPFGGGCSH